ncbi:MAG: 2-phospho-L-lactate transferase [Candidatus Hydrothermarchaeaceae archaeon]
MIVVLSGGTGTPKLLQGMMDVAGPEDITVIVNTAEDMWLSHGFFSPDIDTVLYTLSGQINADTWYGISGDTFETHRRLISSGHPEMLNIGDRDREMHIRRGNLLKSNKTLTLAVDTERLKMGIASKVLPMSDDKVQTVIVTAHGEMNLHEYLIEHRGKPKVDDIYFKGIKNAKATKEAASAVKHADRVIIGPSNPVSSILPIISLSGFKFEREKTLAISPLIGGRPVSGPADKFMQARGVKPNIDGLASIYHGLIHTLVVDNDEKDLEIDDITIARTNTIMRKKEEKRTLARFVLAL